MQVDFKEDLGIQAYHILLCNKVKSYSNYLMCKEITTILQDNRGESGLVQKFNRDNLVLNQSSKSILELFL